jgi:hypothetical protein
VLDRRTRQLARPADAALTGVLGNVDHVTKTPIEPRSKYIPEPPDLGDAAEHYISASFQPKKQISQEKFLNFPGNARTKSPVRPDGADLRSPFFPSPPTGGWGRGGFGRGGPRRGAARSRSRPPIARTRRL